MKRIFLVGIVIGIVGLFWLGRLAWFGENDVSTAQSSDLENQKRRDRDKNVSKEKVDNALAEITKIQSSILAIIAEKKPEFKFERKDLSHPMSQGIGQRGATGQDISWRTSKKTDLHISVNLGLTKDQQLIWFREGFRYISAGDFFEIPNIGDEATLVKRVVPRFKFTHLALHFMKGRAIVIVSISNYKRKPEKLENELMEIVRLIEPLILARPNFDDP